MPLATRLDARVRRREMARRRRRPGTSVPARVPILASVLVLVVGIAAVLAAARPAGPADPGAGGDRAASIRIATPSPDPTSGSARTGPVSGSAAAAPTAVPTAAPPTPRPTPAPATPQPTATPLRPPPGEAPVAGPGFDHERVVLPMAFPFRRDVGYRYRDNFLDRRAGRAYPYNHVLHRKPDGTLQRAHDGTDIYVERGTPVRSPFRGIVVDPAKLWRPWVPERYGLTVVVVSEEPATRGYAALHAHLSSVDVRIGERVRRGDRLGGAGNTGNAEDTPPHVHFELRAPFVFPVREAGRIRWLDAVNPYPSLYRADPRQE